MKSQSAAPWLNRARLTSLWVSQVARISADNALRIYIALRLAHAGAAERDYAWHLLSALLMLPSVLLAPFNGALCNTLPKRWVLVGSAAYCCAVVAVFGYTDGPWVAAWALLAAGAAVYSPTRYALLPAASADAHVPLTRVNGWIEMGAVTAIVAGMAVGVHLERDFLTWDGWPPVVLLAVGLNVLGILTALPVAFPSDIRRAASAGHAIGGFFRDARRICRDREARAALLGLAVLRAIVTGATGAFFAVMLADESGSPLDRIDAGFAILAWILLGAAAGSVLAGVEKHPIRALGLVPLGATGLCIGLFAAAAGTTTPVVCVLLGVMGGLINVPLAAAYQTYVPADALGNAMSIRNLTDYLLMTAISLLLFGLASAQVIGAAGQMWLVAALATLATAVAWRAAYRETIELLTEIALLPFYRIKAYGDGFYHFPKRGPVLVVANHGAWLDPLWLAKVLPRSLRPMMTSAFYDLPGMRVLMKYVARAIRVQYSTFRREAPELQEAIEALDAGETVVIFPEGLLRRSEEKPLRRFGQGVYHILSERPETTVVVCWIEGNWGSFFSYFKGPPTKNKRFDFCRRIRIAVGEPMVLDPATLADHKSTRAFLEECCLRMRGVLGLSVPKLDKEPDPAET